MYLMVYDLIVYEPLSARSCAMYLISSITVIYTQMFSCPTGFIYFLAYIYCTCNLSGALITVYHTVKYM